MQSDVHGRITNALVCELFARDAGELHRLRKKGVDLRQKGIATREPKKPTYFNTRVYNWEGFSFVPKHRTPFGTTGHLSSYETTYAGDFQSGDDQKFNELLKIELQSAPRPPALGRRRLRARQRKLSGDGCARARTAPAKVAEQLTLAALLGPEERVRSVLKPGSRRAPTPPQGPRPPFYPTFNGSPIAHGSDASQERASPARVRPRGVKRVHLPGIREGSGLQLALAAWGQSVGWDDSVTDKVNTSEIKCRPRKLEIAEKPQRAYAGDIARMLRSAQQRAEDNLVEHDAARSARARAPWVPQPPERPPSGGARPLTRSGRLPSGHLPN